VYVGGLPGAVKVEVNCNWPGEKVETMLAEGSELKTELDT